MKKKYKKSAFSHICSDCRNAYIQRVVDSNAERKNALKVDNGHYYKWKEGNIFYTKTGTGKPILLIHDTDSGASGEEWAKVAKKLAKTIPYTLLICLDVAARTSLPSNIQATCMYRFSQLL